MSLLGDKALVISDPSDETPGGLYVYDGGQVEILDRVSTTGLGVTPAGHVLRLPRSFDEAGSSGELIVYDERGVTSYHRLDGIADAHGVAWDGDSYAVVSTATNAVVWFDEAGRRVREWRPEGDRDAWHLNDLFLRDGVMHVSAFGRFSDHRGWAGNLTGSGIVVALPEGRDVIEGLSAPHTPRYVDGRWVVCDSATRELVAIDGSSGEVVERLALRTWPRGLALHEGHLFVGESEHRVENADPKAQATVAVVDSSDWTVVERIAVPGREIYDLLVVDRAQVEGLATGFRTNTFRARATRQLRLFEDVGVEPTRLWAVGEPVPEADRRVRVAAELPARVAAGATVEIPVELENLGAALLITATPNPVYLTYRWFRDGEPGAIVEAPLMSPLPHALPPRETMRCAVRVAAHGPGRYRLRITLAQEYVGWFDDADESSVAEGVVDVEDAAAPLQSDVP